MSDVRQGVRNALDEWCYSKALRGGTLAPGLPEQYLVARMKEKTRHLLPIMISIAMMYGAALAQTSSSPPQAMLPSSPSIHELSGEGLATSKQEPVRQGATNSCNLRLVRRIHG